MLGTIVNASAIIAGSLLGFVFGKGIPDRYNKSVMQAVALAVFLIGIKGALSCDAIMMIIASLVVGTILGEAFRIEDGLAALGKLIEAKFARGGDGQVGKAFVAASLIFCVGSMAIVGSLESGLTGSHETLFAKSALDGVSSVIFTATLGIGVIFSSIAVLFYQGLITIGAGLIQPYLTEAVITQMSGVGGLLILAIALNILEITKIRIGNMLPAIFVPLVWFGIRSAAGF